MVSNDGNVYQQNDCVTGWWKLDENVDIIPATTIAQDSSGNGHHGTYKSPDGGPSDGVPGFSYGPPRINAYSFNTGDDAATPAMKGGVYLPTAGSLRLSNDASFTIQGWFLQRVNRISQDGLILSINVANSNNNRLWIYSDDHANNKIKLSLFEGTLSHGATINGPNIDINKWYHFAATYDNVNLTLYVNGKKYGSIAKSSTDPGIQSTDVVSIAGDRDGDGLDQIFRGHLSNFAVWSRALSNDSIKALAGATAGHYQIGSGLLNNPERVNIRDLDNMTGSYPTISRTTGIKGTVGNSPITPYNETRAVQFNKTAAMSNYPMVLNNVGHLAGKTYADDFNKNWIATPNISGSIDAPAKSKPFLSLQNLTPSIDQGLNLTPFDESRIEIRDTPFYLTGTTNSVLPGFSSRLADKIQIKIPLPNAKDKRITRFNARGLAGEIENIDSTQSELTSSFTNTGFAYYNFDLQQWEDIGSTDPVTKSDLKPTFFYTQEFSSGQWEPFNTSPRWENRGGGHLKRYQFGMSNHLGHRAGTYDDLVNLGYKHIGSPTMSGYAPGSPSYHATSSQALSLSDYISHPFVLEKAVIEIPVTVRRVNGSRHSRDENVANATAGANAMKQRLDTTVRDIDNYMFFMYRQSRNGPGPIDSAVDASGSMRFLVMSASAAFWNGPTFNSTVSSSIVEKGLPHSPAFSYDFNLPVSASHFFGHNGDTRVSIPGRPMVSEYTGTLRLEMIPAVGSGKKGAGSRFFMRGCQANPEANGIQPGAAYFYNNITVQDFWPGGTTFGGYTSGPPQAHAKGPAFVKPLKRSTSLVPIHTSTSQFFPHKNFTNKYFALGANNVRAAFFKEYAPFQGIRSWQYDNNTTGSFGVTGSIPFSIFQDGRPMRNPHGLRNYNGVIVGEVTRTSSYTIASHTTAAYGTNRFGGGTNELKNIGAEFRSAYEGLAFGKKTTSAAGAVDRSGGGYGTLTYTPNIATSTPSPYVLMPGDKLVFGVDSGISALPVSSSTADFQPGNTGLLNGFAINDKLHQISGSQMWIQAGEASITLFGSMIKDNREKLSELNQPLTSPAIHEALHFDNPVVDQFITYPKSAFSGSYTDNIILGYYYGAEKMDREIASNGAFDKANGHGWNQAIPRGVYGYISAGDRVGDKYIDKAITSDTTDYFYSQPDNASPVGALRIGHGDKFGQRWFNQLMAASSRSTRHHTMVKVSSYGERYYDTVMPNLTDFCVRSGMSWDGADIITGTLGGNLTEGSIGGVHHKHSYPYATSITRPLFDQKKFLFKVDGVAAKGQNANLIKGNVIDPTDDIDTGEPGWSSAFDVLAMNALLFKKGGYEFTFPAGVANTKVVARWSPDDMQYPHDPSSKATGYAYGILDIRRKFASAMFRYDRFGQFRDMLEQRRDAKFWATDVGDPLVNNQDGSGEYSSDFVIGFGEIDGPVQCRFVTQEDGRTVISPYDTDSNNMSLESTSSMPYFDNLSRNVSSGSTNSTVLYRDSYIQSLGRAPWSGFDDMGGNDFVPGSIGANTFGQFNNNLIAGGTKVTLLDIGTILGAVTGDQCFTAGTMVMLHDGTSIEIETIVEGDVVLGSGGSRNTVVSLVSRDIEKGVLYSINNSDPFVTAGHPFKTTAGWKSIDPEVSREIDPDLFEELGITTLATGDVLIASDNNNVTIDIIRGSYVDRETVYNLDVDGDSTYFANTYLVHNKTTAGGGGSAGPRLGGGNTVARNLPTSGMQGPGSKLTE